MKNLIDIDYLVDSMDELCNLAPVTVEQANSCKSTIIWGLNQSYQTLQDASFQERQEYISKVNLVISLYQYPSLLVYSRFKDFPYLIDAINATDNRLAYMSQIRSSEELSRLIMLKNIDNTLSDAMIRLVNYMDNIISDVSFDVLYHQDKNTLELALIGLSQLVPQNISEYVFDSMYNDYECELLTECDYTSILSQYESRYEEPTTEMINKYYDNNDLILSGSRDMMFRNWKSSFITGDPISRDVIHAGLLAFGSAFSNNLNQYTIITPEEQKNIAEDYSNQMYVDCSDAILRNFIYTMFRHGKEEILRSTSPDVSIKIFVYIVQVFRFIIKLGREISRNDNIGRN